MLHLFGNGSHVACGGAAAIQGWEWSVKGPPGSSTRFLPSPDVPEPTLLVDVAGLYAVSLAVVDDAGVSSATPAEYSVSVIPDQALWIELLWSIKDYPEEGNSEIAWDGTPDLHLAHVLADEGPDVDADGNVEPWFILPYDAWWFNPDPDWGPPGPEGNPLHMSWGQGGGGPEAITVLGPEFLAYRIGVHYQDEGYGPALVTVRVYVFSVLAFELTDVWLHDCDVWEVGAVEWPSGKVMVATDGVGAPKILNCSLWCFHGDGW
ncbi:MAG: hypothetical protein ABIK09_18565 [Pseudomonadota bacterium]